MSKPVETTVGKGKIARYEQFLLFQQCFQKARFLEASKGVIVWEWVKVGDLSRTVRKFGGFLQKWGIPAIPGPRINTKPIPKQLILDSSKLKEFADSNFKFDENGRKISKGVENTVGKGEIFKILVLQTGKNQGLFGKGLRFPPPLCSLL